MSEPAPSDWVIYSDTKKRLQPRGLRAGRMVAATPLTVPDRWSHAVVPGTEVTLCGLAIDQLHAFEGQVFRHLNPYLRCRECDEIAGHPEALS